MDIKKDDPRRIQESSLGLLNKRLLLIRVHKPGHSSHHGMDAFFFDHFCYIVAARAGGICLKVAEYNDHITEKEKDASLPNIYCSKVCQYRKIHHELPDCIVP